MNISSSTSYSTGLSAIQTGLARLDQAASDVANSASATSQSSNYQAERLRGVDRSQLDPASAAVAMIQAQIQVQAGTKVEKAADQALGSLIDIYA
jgi:flagellar basal body rod protein FlgG